MEKLKKNLLKLQNLDDSLNKKFEEYINKKDLKKLLLDAIKIVQLKSKIKTEFARSSTFIFDEDSSNAKMILQNINSGKLFFADIVLKSFENTIGKSLDLESLSFDQLDQLASDELYSWFDPMSYIERLIQIGTLILDIDIPKELEFIAKEARLCYAFEQYIAVSSLCRTLLESAMRDICIRTGDIKKNEDDKPSKLRNIISKDDPALKTRIKKLYRRLSKIIHGSIPNDLINVQSTFKETALIVQELYERNRNRIKKRK